MELSKNFTGLFSRKENINAKNSTDKENFRIRNNENSKKDKNAEKNVKIVSKKHSKIFTNDLFDLGLINEIQAKETFMLDTILRSAVLNR